MHHTEPTATIAVGYRDGTRSVTVRRVDDDPRSRAYATVAVAVAVALVVLLPTRGDVVVAAGMAVLLVEAHEPRRRERARRAASVRPERDGAQGSVGGRPPSDPGTDRP